MEIISWKEDQVFTEERFNKQQLFSDKNNTIFVLNFLPGQDLPVHSHPGKDVFILILQGNGDCQIDEETVTLSEGDFLHLDEATKIGFINNSKAPFSVYITLHNKGDE